MIAGGVVAAGYGAAILGGAVGLAPLIALPVLVLGWSRHSEVRAGRRYLLKRGRMLTDRRILDVKQIEIRIVPSEYAQGWALRFFGFTMPVDITGDDALHTVQKVMPALNMMGGLRSSVDKAVKEIESVGEPEGYFRRVIDYARRNRMSYTPLQEFPSAVRLAVEMASHEETERRALVEGELSQLEADWREAEEIAKIADNLFLPKHVSDFIDQNRADSQ